MDAVNNKLELFVHNAQIVKKEFRWHHALTRKFAALLYARDGLTVDCYAIRKCYMLIKQSAGPFSAFRGNLALCLASLLSLSPDPQELLDNTQKVYGLLRDERLHASDYLVIASYEIAAGVSPMRYYETAIRTRAFYDRMKSKRFFLTGQDDYIFAAMLGLSDLDVTVGTDRIDKLYMRLKGEFWDKNSTQALAQILVLSGTDNNVVDKIITLRDAFKANKIRMDKAYTIPALGILAMLPVNVEVIVRDIIESLKELRQQKGFGSWSISNQELLIYAAAIVANEHAYELRDSVVSAAVATGIANIMIAQQAAMIAMISSSAAVAASS